MAGNNAVCNIGWLVADHNHARHVTAAVNSSLRTPRVPALAQTLRHFAAQLAASLDVQVLADRLVTHGHLRLLRVIDP
jgi:hypothetical protein